MHTGATTTPSLRAANTTVLIHSVLASKLSLALKVAGKATDRDTDLHMVFTSRNLFVMQGPVAIILIS
jgi:hypothetical protein